MTSVVGVSLHYSLLLQGSNRKLASALDVARGQERLARDHEATAQRSFYAASMGLAQEAGLNRIGFVAQTPAAAASAAR